MFIKCTKLIHNNYQGYQFGIGIYMTFEINRQINSEK